MNNKRISILGSTGSIGIQSLDVINQSKNGYELNYLTTNTNIDLLEKQTKEFSPLGVVIRDENAYKQFKSQTSFKGEILCGEDALIHAASYSENDMLVSALVGFSGVLPTLAAIKKGIDIALANKETLVSAGEIITKAAKDNDSKLITCDSEHSAILQCIVGEKSEDIEKIILTASGGPFRDTPLEDFENLSLKQALNHPNWSMGSKITIDSATMMNKGLEVIEAYWLFGMDIKDIEVVIHPQSIIHSFVQFVDGSMKAQLGLPDMRIPISYALSYPERHEFDFPRLDLYELKELTFRKPDYQRAPCLKLAFDSLIKGGNIPALLNAANEIAVNEFLHEKIRFIDICKYIEQTIDKIEYIESPTLEDIIASDMESRNICKDLIAN